MKHSPALDDLSRFLIAKNSVLSTEQREKMQEYLELLRYWSGRQNLVSRQDLPFLVERHFIPSLFLNVCLPENLSGALMDLGSGAGFPGVLIAIMRPSLSVTLLDASRKKTLFLTEVCARLALNCRVVCQRCENYAPPTDQKYRTIVARAVARIDKLLEWTRTLQDKGDLFFAMKGGDEKLEAKVWPPNGGTYTVLKPDETWITFSAFLRQKYILRVER